MVEGATSDLFQLQNTIVQRVISAVDVQDPWAAAQAGRTSTRDVEAFGDYSQGRALLDRVDIPGNVDAAIHAYGRAIAKDPQFALAHAGLGDAYCARPRTDRPDGCRGRMDAGQPAFSGGHCRRAGVREHGRTPARGGAIFDRARGARPLLLLRAQWIIVTQLDPDTAQNVWRVPAGDGEPKVLVRSSGRDMGGPISPDGRWLA